MEILLLRLWRKMTLLKSKNTFLLLIISFFLITRLYKIDQIPLSVYWDEASIGYNAYSIAETGKDEWGDFLPIHFRAFGEFKLPVYIYSVVPFVKLFGLNEVSVRLPAVFFSLGTVILVYFLAKRFFDSQKVGLFAAFLVTISPWFFLFSRTGYEATAGLMFYLLGIYLFLNSQKRVFILLSVICFVLSIYSYNSFRVISLPTLLILFILQFKNIELKRNLAILIISVILLIISILPIYRLYKYDMGIQRLQTVSTSTTNFFSNYLSHFSLDFLFISGDDNLRSHVPFAGQLFLFDVVLLPLGLIYIIGRKQKRYLLPIILSLLAPIPAAITKESPHALRSISVVPFIHLISAVGILKLMDFIHKGSWVLLVTLIISLTFFLNYFFNFINFYPHNSSQDWQYGYKKIFTEYKEEFEKYDQIFVTDRYAQPYIFALFYLQYDPNKFRSEVTRNSVDQWGFSTVAGFGKFKFGKLDQLPKEEDALIFISENEVYKNE